MLSPFCFLVLPDKSSLQLNYPFAEFSTAEKKRSGSAFHPAGNLLHLCLVQELDNCVVSNMPEPAGTSAMVAYAVPGVT